MPSEDLQRLAAEWVETFNHADWLRQRELLAPDLAHNLLEPTRDDNAMRSGRTVVDRADDSQAAWQRLRSITSHLSSLSDPGLSTNVRTPPSE